MQRNLVSGGSHLTNTVHTDSTCDDDEDTGMISSEESEPERTEPHVRPGYLSARHCDSSVNCSEQYESNVNRTLRGQPNVSQKWADMRHRSPEEMTDQELLLLQSVRAETLFSDGPGGKGGQEEAFEIPFNPLNP